MAVRFELAYDPFRFIYRDHIICRSVECPDGKMFQAADFSSVAIVYTTAQGGAIAANLSG